jgi:methionyl aminopeptidase
MNRLIKTNQEIDMIREGGHILDRILQEVAALARPGIETKVLEDKALELIEKVGGRPAFKGYKPDKHSKPFPSALCISVNEEIVHGPAVPSRELKEGQIVTLDIGMEYPYIKGKKGYYTDMATTVGVGNISIEARKLLAGTKESLEAGISFVKPGVTLNELGKTIETVLKKYNLGVIRDLVGHGVGLDVHEPPQVPNYSFKKNEFTDMELKPGMVIAIEPMATLGSWQIAAADDGFTYITADKSLAAHFEHTILVTEEGSEILTKSGS